jgi:hypothetical protein
MTHLSLLATSFLAALPRDGSVVSAADLAKNFSGQSRNDINDALHQLWSEKLATFSWVGSKPHYALANMVASVVQ